MVNSIDIRAAEHRAKGFWAHLTNINCPVVQEQYMIIYEFDNPVFVLTNMTESTNNKKTGDGMKVYDVISGKVLI